MIPRSPVSPFLATALLSLTTLCVQQPDEIVLASTTSTQDSGLFDHILPAFHAEHPGLRVRVIAVGSGEALRIASRGDADAVLSHSPEAEISFMEAGHGESRRRVMYNDFVIVGPPDGPAASCGGTDAIPALTCISELEAPFISRGDDSGTYARERRLWSLAGIDPEGDWYLRSGQGMGEVLMMASEKAAYSLGDRGTYLSLADRLDLEILVEGDPLLRNQYSVIVVRRAANRRGAKAFAGWIISPAAQRLIGDLGSAGSGRPLFVPNARAE